MDDRPDESQVPLRVLVTLGPTYEPIDNVRFLGNRSSGRMGQAIAQNAAERGHAVTALVGPVDSTAVPCHSRIRVLRFQTTAELQDLLRQTWPDHDLLIMAAAVADYRPREPLTGAKIPRTSEGLTLHLEPTPDLVAEAAASRRPGQFIVAFALEEPDRLSQSARQKLHRKGVDAVVANPLDTMNSSHVHGTMFAATGEAFIPDHPGKIEKTAFAAWLLTTVLQLRSTAQTPRAGQDPRG